MTRTPVLTLLALVASAWLLAAPPALAAPTCRNANGEAIRCGTPGAMPVGWSPPQWIVERRLARATPPNPAQALGLIAFVGAFFALIALMPPFDGWGAGDWDEQEGDREG